MKVLENKSFCVDGALKRIFEEGFSLRHFASRGGLRGDAFIIAFVRSKVKRPKTWPLVRYTWGKISTIWSEMRNLNFWRHNTYFSTNKKSQTFEFFGAKTRIFSLIINLNFLNFWRQNTYFFTNKNWNIWIFGAKTRIFSLIKNLKYLNFLAPKHVFFTNNKSQIFEFLAPKHVFFN